MDYWEAKDRKAAVKAAEDAGTVADSLDVRMAIIARVKSGEIMLEQAQAELRAIKRGAKAKGLTTRSRAWRGR